MLPVLVYALGLLALLGRLVVQRRRARLIAREATIVSDPDWTALLDECATRIGVRCPVTLLRSRDQLMPMTMGTIAPVIVVPADADTWDEERRSAVLLHELAHIARHDCLTQTVCALVSAMYWLHPGMWYVARRLRIEREVACDDCVLAAGAHAGSYAGHLLELAYAWSGRRAPALVVGMAGSRKLEGRMRAVLDPERNRRAPSNRTWLVGTALAAAVLLPLAAMNLTTASARGSFDEEHAARPQTSDRSIGAPDTTSGTWEVRPARTLGRVSLRIRLGVSSFNSDIDVNEIERLTEQRPLTADGPIRFSVPREAGSFEIEGTMKAGAGNGTFRFVPSQPFIVGLTGRGFALPSAVELMMMAQQNLGFAFIDELAAQKYVQPLVPDLIRAAHHGVDLDFVRGVGQTGYRLGTLDLLIRFRDHGVDPEFIRGLRAQGVELAPDDLVRARDHGVDPEYAAGLKSAGYESLSFDALLRARDHGVDPEYLGAMRDLGYAKQPLEEVIRVRDHGVDPEYVREMRRLGYTLTLQELITARDHGVDPNYIEAMAALGYKALTIETLIRLRDHGVSPDYAAEAQKRGLKNLSPEEIIRMRDRGEASSDYRIDRLIADLSQMVRKLERAFDKTMAKAEKEVQKAEKTAQKLQKTADKLSR
jgi:beta-lactamase regulating signal transducer with metallopeptidase domain